MCKEIITKTYPENIPGELRELNQWVTWNLAPNPKGGKPRKIPFNANTDKYASSTDPATWCSYEEALAAYETGNYNGIGFVLSESDPFCCVDVDGCISEHGQYSELAQHCISMVPTTYVELSQSGRGVHIFVKGRMTGEGLNVDEIECYDRKRFIAMTGCVIGGVQ